MKVGVGDMMAGAGDLMVQVIPLPSRNPSEASVEATHVSHRGANVGDPVKAALNIAYMSKKSWDIAPA